MAHTYGRLLGGSGHNFQLLRSLNFSGSVSQAGYSDVLLHFKQLTLKIK